MAHTLFCSKLQVDVRMCATTQDAGNRSARAVSWRLAYNINWLITLFENAGERLPKMCEIVLTRLAYNINWLITLFCLKLQVNVRMCVTTQDAGNRSVRAVSWRLISAFIRERNRSRVLLKVNLIICMMGNFENFFVVCWYFPKSTFSKNSFRNIIRVSSSLEPE